MTDLALVEQGADLFEFFVDRRVGRRQLQAAEQLQVFAVATVVVDRIVDFQPVFEPDDVVILTVAGGGVHTAGARFEGDVVAEHDQ